MNLKKFRKKLRRKLAVFEDNIRAADRRWEMRMDAMDCMDLTAILTNNKQLEEERHKMRKKFVDDIVGLVGKD